MTASRSDDLTGTMDTIDIPQSVHTQLDADAEGLSMTSFDPYTPHILCFVMWTSAEAYKKTNWPIIPATMEGCTELWSRTKKSETFYERHTASDITLRFAGEVSSRLHAHNSCTDRSHRS